MKLIFLSEVNLKDRLFIRDLVHNFKSSEKAILIHDAYGDRIPETRFVTKRLSALFSEAMVYNRAFSAEQRKLFFIESDSLKLNKEKIDGLLQEVSLLIIGPVVSVEGTSQLIATADMLACVREVYQIEEIILFSDNPMSPLASKRPLISEANDQEALLTAYEEEKAAISRALDLRPARIVSPTNYMS